MTPIITGPGSYVTREGKRVEVTRFDHGLYSDTHHWIGDGDRACTRNDAGRVMLDTSEHHNDIVEPRIDEVRIGPIPRDFRPIPGRHKAVYRDGRRAEVYGVTDSVFETNGRYARFDTYRDGVYRNDGCADECLDIVAFIDTKPETTSTKETPMSINASPIAFSSIDQIKVGMRVRLIKGGHYGFVKGVVYTVTCVDPGLVGFDHTQSADRGYIGGLKGCAWFGACSLAPADESPLALARAEVARLEAEEAAAKALASLPEPLRKCHEYLKANPDAFGCQARHVRAIVEALTGGKLP